MVSIWIVAIGNACSVADGVELRASEAPLFSAREKLWPLAPLRATQIPVCFERGREGTAHAQLVTRDALEDTWERVANIDFTEWDTCVGNDPGLHVQFRDEQPHTDGLGTDLDRRTNGITLNERFVNWSQPACRSDGGARDQCMRNIAVHEFGHALGFAHDPDEHGPDCCPTGDPGVQVTANDPRSIMRSCNRNSDQLSELDVIGVRTQYAPKPGLSIVGLGGKCLDLPSESTAIGTRLQLFACHGGDNQRWPYSSTSHHLQTALDADRHVSHNDDVPYLDHQRDDIHERWYFADAELRSYGDLCVDTGVATAGVQPTAVACESSLLAHPAAINQRWTFDTARQLRPRLDLSLCLQGEGSNARLRACDGQPGQKWQLIGLGRIRNEALQTCLFFDNAERLRLGACSGLGVFAGWHFGTAIKSNGTCMTVEGNAEGDDHDLIEMASCAELGVNDRQVFDVYF